MWCSSSPTLIHFSESTPFTRASSCHCTQEYIKGTGPRVWGGMGLALGVMRVPEDPLGDAWVRFSQRLVGRLPTEVLSAVSRNHLSSPLRLFGIFIFCLFPDRLSPPSYGVSTKYLGCCWSKSICSVVSSTAGEAEHSLTVLPFLVQPMQCCLRKGVALATFFLPFLMCPNTYIFFNYYYFFLLQQCAGIFPWEG